MPLLSELARSTPDATSGVPLMKAELQAIFDSTPADEPRSRLEPYRELILRWRRQGKTYRRICVLLADHCKVQMDCAGLYRFMKRSSKPRKPMPELEFEQPTSSPEPQPVSQPATSGKRLSAEERAAQVEFIRSLNQSASQDLPAKPRWNLDVDKPRTIHKPEGEV
jgi:hypothetical protein